ncbi:hypothetical protein C8Q80DRAFT_290282 [Daedaleopsis nitida]|nr:hypothetical protein C8Q80DRAFT_290282 [Daedaleopsis nitida]
MDTVTVEGKPTPGPVPLGTPLPLSANVEESRPEIGGSFGGFVGLVVGLSAIFLISCIGIFILLRNHEPTSHERQMRRARARTHDFSTELPIGPPGIRERLARLFGKRTGWVKASGGDGDEWDASEDLAPYYDASELRERDRGAHLYPASMASSATQSHMHPSRSTTTDSVQVGLHAPSGQSSLIGASFLPDEDEDAPRDPDRAETSSTVPLRHSPPSMLPADADEEGYEPRDDRHFSIQTSSSGTGSVSIRSMRKFDNGTKFKEGLNF